MENRLEELCELLLNDNTNLELLEERGMLYYEFEEYRNCVDDLLIVESNKVMEEYSIVTLIVSLLHLELYDDAIELGIKYGLYGLVSNTYLKLEDNDNAIKYSELVNANNKEELLRKAFTYSSLNKFEEALVVIEKALEIDSEYFDAYYDLIMVLTKSKMFDEAKEMSEFIVLKDFMTLKYQSDLIMLWQYKDNEFALKLTNILLEELDHPWFMNVKGILLAELKRYDESIECFKYIISKDEEYDSAYGNLGNLYLKQNNFEEGFAAYENAISLNPDNPSNYYTRGNHLLRMGKVDLALDDFNVLYDKTNDPNVLVDIAKCYKELSNIKSLELFNTACELIPNSPYILNQKMQAETYFNQHEEALKTVNKLFDVIGYNDPYLYYSRAFIYKDLQQNDKALKEFKRTFDMAPDYDEGVIRNIISLSFEENNFKWVIKYADILLKDVEDHIIYYYRAQAYKKLKDFKSALSDFDIFLKKEPNDAISLLGKAECLFELEKYKQAIKTMDLIDDKNLEYEVYELKSMCYLETKDYKKALSILDYLILKNPTTKVKYMMLKALSVQKKYKEIIKKSKVFMDGEADTEVFIYMIADAYKSLGKNKEAIEEFNKIIDENKPVKLYLEKRAYCYSDIEDFNSALKDYTTLINNFDDVDMYYFRACSYVDIADYESALKDFNEALKGMFPEFVYYDIGNTYIHMKQYDKAIENFKKSYDIDNSQPECITNMAGCYVEIEEYDKALQILSEITEDFPETYVLEMLYIKISIGKKDYNQALNLVNVYLTKHENSVHIKFLLGKIYFLLKDDRCIELLQEVINHKLDTTKAHRVASFKEEQEECIKMLKEFKS